jgi:PleD family two-component response regulator
MLTNVINLTSGTTGRRSHRDDVTAQKVVIINGGNEVPELLDTVLDAGSYDVVFVEAIAHAYSQVKRVQPQLVILCVHMDDVDGFRVLSMLKLDAETRSIPILTYTIESGDEPQDEEPEPMEDEMFAPKPALQMH